MSADRDAATRQALLGTWTLVSCINEDAASGERSDFMGPSPEGYINYSADGRMLVVIVRSGRTPPAGDVADAAEAERLFRSCVAYGGTFRVEGDTVWHDVDISWNEAWTGTSQTRKFRLEGDRLTLSNGPNLDPLNGRMSTRTMTWRRAQAAS